MGAGGEGWVGEDGGESGVTMQRMFEFTLFADYFQFYLQDESSSGDLSDSWTQEAVDRLLAIAPGTIGVGTVRNMKVRVTVEIEDEEPAEDLALWDQVNECSIDVPSGRLVVAGCTDYFPDAPRIELQPGPYRARICYRNLDKLSLSADGLEGDDSYRIVLSRMSPEPFRTVKGRTNQKADKLSLIHI